MPSTSRSLILGVAAGYRPYLVMPFLKSLKATDYAGKVCLFVSDLSKEEIKEIKVYADEVITLDNAYGHEITRYGLNGYAKWLTKLRVTKRIRRLYPFLFALTLRRASDARRKALQIDLEQRLEGFQTLRYQIYADYLNLQGQDADYVMITDVRDVIFQDDPFKQPLTSELETFLEADSLTIEKEPFNRRWIINLYGMAVLQHIGPQTASCSGTTIGTYTGMMRYLKTMAKEINKHSRPLGSHDQGIHNYLLRTSKFEPVTIFANGYGTVLTMGAETNITRDAEGQYLNRDSHPVPVVHQYDRHPKLADEVRAKYA